ncbi:MAG TPA: rhodanese-like domain-containing protein [Arachnia sp.]|nr:rhodanese-like domain-containing protein [Arachnia sp.]HMT85829.1 rhodanese-like domain-containing protein [Arachnia sp.]
MSRIFRQLAVLAMALGLTLGMAGCGSEPTELPEGTVLIDVRTPQEFADGHLQDAINIDIQSPDFTAQLSELPTDGSYVVYCRSGNRSAQAISQMTQLGFTTLIDGGGLGAASRTTGADIVTDS